MGLRILSSACIPLSVCNGFCPKDRVLFGITRGTNAMRILMLNQAPKRKDKHPAYDVATIEKLVNSYASPGTRIEIGFPDDFEGSKIFHQLGAASNLNGLHHMMETPAIVLKIVWAA